MLRSVVQGTQTHNLLNVRTFVLAAHRHRLLAVQQDSWQKGPLRHRPGTGNVLEEALPWRGQRKQQIRSFHATPRRDGLWHALLANVLKTSMAFEYARMAARVTLTFVPFAIIQRHFARKYIQHAKETPDYAEKKVKMEKIVRRGLIFYRVLVAIPVTLFALTCLASLERTPLSGRWRLILLSPEEEDTIASQLQGEGWFKAVHDILSEDGPPKVIPPTDWRYQWVNDTLRQLETVVPILAQEKVMMVRDLKVKHDWLNRDPDDIPLPPPSKYPLRPRPAAKDYLRWFCEEKAFKKPGSQTYVPAHTVSGPPYSLLLIDDPDCDNAFSFGFGPNGGGGVVVYSGFLDRVLAGGMDDAQTGPDVPVLQPTPSQPLLSGFFSGLFPRQAAPISAPLRQAPAPTQEQTDQLAILLAHELAHLVLSHHLETLSSGTVVVPGSLSMLSDLLRAVLFPFTMIFGPFVNDAVANLGRVGSMEVGKLSEYCTSMSQEFEADAVSARILAHAGYDARKTINFWETRRDVEVSECSPRRASIALAREGDPSLVRRIMGAAHPAHSARVDRLRAELEGWERVREKYRQKFKRHDKWAQDKAMKEAWWKAHMGGGGK